MRGPGGGLGGGLGEGEGEGALERQEGGCRTSQDLVLEPVMHCAPGSQQRELSSHWSPLMKHWVWDRLRWRDGSGTHWEREAVRAAQRLPGMQSESLEQPVL